MVKILAFPGTKNIKKIAEQLSASATETPRITSLADGSFVISGKDDSESRTGGDWSNQELADLYRVESLLIQANIRISTARGLTDEGDPWFAFCKEDHDVFVHLARIDGGYLLDSPGLGEILEGHDFPELISRFVRQIAAKAAPENNVVTLRPRMLHDHTIKLHPAVMLAALVWALYLASDDFVGVAHAMEEIDGRTPHHPATASIHEALNSTVAPEIALRDLADHVSATKPSITASASQTERLMPFHGMDATRSAISSSADGRSATFTPPAALAPVTTQSIAASLAVIAVSYGFYQVSENDTQAHESAAIQPTALTFGHSKAQFQNGTDKIDTADIAIDNSTSAPKSSETLQQEIAHEIKISMLETFALGPVKTTTLPQLHLIGAQILSVASDTPNVNVSAAAEAQQVGTPEPAVAAKSSKGISASSAAPSLTDASKAASNTGRSPTETKETKIESLTMTEAASILKLVDQYVGGVSNYKIGSMSVSATFKVAELGKVLGHMDNAGDQIDAKNIISHDATEVPAPLSHPTSSLSSTLAVSLYDEKAKTFVNHFIQSAGTIEMMQVNAEIILVDMSAIDDKSDHAYAKSWVTDDGHIISTVGHLEDFIHYGLV